MKKIIGINGAEQREHAKAEIVEVISHFSQVEQAYIPVTNQDAGFRVLEQFQFKAHLCRNGYSG